MPIRLVENWLNAHLTTRKVVEQGCKGGLVISIKYISQSRLGAIIWVEERIYYFIVFACKIRGRRPHQYSIHPKCHMSTVPVVYGDGQGMVAIVHYSKCIAYSLTVYALKIIYCHHCMISGHDFDIANAILQRDQSSILIILLH